MQGRCCASSIGSNTTGTRLRRRPVLANIPLTPTVSVLLPTYNERDNIGVLVPRVLEVLGPVGVEVLIVDDGSPDGTADVARQLAEADSRVRLRVREAKMGLSSAVFAGVEMASGRYVCVMDADLSHDPEELPDMLAMAESGCDVVVGSRFARGGSLGSPTLGRRIVSVATNIVARTLLGLRTKDVLTGFVLCRREVLAELPRQYSSGSFKFLLELLATRPGLAVGEWPIVFQARASGSSKANVGEGVRLALLCTRLLGLRIRRGLAGDAS